MEDLLPQIIEYFLLLVFLSDNFKSALSELNSTLYILTEKSPWVHQTQISPPTIVIRYPKINTSSDPSQFIPNNNIKSSSRSQPNSNNSSAFISFNS